MIDRLEGRVVKRGRALKRLADMLNAVPGDTELWEGVLAGDLYHIVTTALRDDVPKRA
jgi:hypothetical protein